MDGFSPTIETPAALQPPEPAGALATRGPEPTRDWLARLRPFRPFLAVVVLPTLLAAAYLFLVAANQYESEARFLVRTNQPSGAAVSGLGKALGLGGGDQAQAEAHGIGDYLSSHDAVAALRRDIDLPAVFRRPEADPFSRLWSADPDPETLLKFYRRQVKVTFNAESGVSTLTVRAFRPADARAIAEALLRLGEARVNSFNQRAIVNSLSVAQAQLREAEIGVARAQSNLTDLRQARRDIDPQRSSSAQISLAAELQQQLALKRAALASMSASVGPESPQRVALAAEVRALQAQVAGAQAQLAGPAGAMATTLGAFESSRLRQDFAAKRYDAAAGALTDAQERALLQQLFVVRVVEPNTPVRALYPQRLKILATIFAGLLLSYAIGWLILAGVHEHKL